MLGWNIELPKTQYFELSEIQNEPLKAHEFQEFIREMAAQPRIAIDTETTGLVSWRDTVLYWSVAWAGKRATLHVNVLYQFLHVFADPSKEWIMANAKYDTHILANNGIELAGRLCCTQVQHSLLYEDKPHGLKFMAKHLLGWTYGDFQDQFGKIGKLQSPTDLIRKAERENMNLLKEYAANDAWATWGVEEILQTQLKNAGTYSLFRNIPPYIETLWDLFSKVEVHYTRALWNMERHGIRVNREHLEKAEPEAQKALTEIEREISKQVGYVLNPRSNKQLKEYFYERMGHTVTKWTKGSNAPSLDASVLKRLSESGDPVAKLIMQHRDYSKLLGTYIQGLHKLLDPNDRIHSRFNQDVARTGRLSCVAEWTPIRSLRVEGHASDLIQDRPINELRIGDLVRTHKDRWMKVLRVFTKGFEDMYDVHFSNGEVLTCTAAHRLLAADGNWFPVGELIDERVEAVGGCGSEPDERAGPVPLEGDLHDGADSKEAEDDVPQRLVRHSAPHAREGEESTSEGAVLSVQDGKEEPDEGQGGKGTPQLDRAMPGREGVLDLSAQRETPVRAQDSDGGCARTEATASALEGAPHRQRQGEQQPGQLGARDVRRAQLPALLAEPGHGPLTVTQVVYRGRLEVHDLTVEEDASYLACGVFSHNSSDPNLQNIPRPENDKWNLRSAFVPAPRHCLIAVDYEQLEMRLLAAAAMEPDMISIFERNWDIHMGNAALMFNIPYDDLKNAKAVEKKVKHKELPADAITAYVRQCLDSRAAAKAIGFGLNYGMGAAKLGGALGVSQAEAQEKINQYKQTYPAVTEFYKEAIEETKKTGYAFTVLGRRRNVAEIGSYKRGERAMGERVAVNTQIQGSAADVCKMAQINLMKVDLEGRHGCKLVLQVHDELVFECPIETREEAMLEITDLMEHPFTQDLAVHLAVDGGHGESWGEAK